MKSVFSLHQRSDARNTTRPALPCISRRHESPGAMDARLDTLMEKIAADAEIAGRGISRDEASEALAEKDGPSGGP